MNIVEIYIYIYFFYTIFELEFYDFAYNNNLFNLIVTL